MSLIPMDMSHLSVQLQNDVQQWRTTIYWAQERIKVYNQNLTTSVMTAAGIGGGDQSAVLAFIADLNRFVTFAGGTLPTVADDMLFDCAAILGIE